MVIELRHHSEKGSQLVIFVTIVIIICERLHYLHEFAHKVWKYSHTKKQSDGYKNSLKIAPGIKISKAHCGQSGETKIHDDNLVLEIRVCFFILQVS